MDSFIFISTKSTDYSRKRMHNSGLQIEKCRAYEELSLILPPRPSALRLKIEHRVLPSVKPYAVKPKLWRTANSLEEGNN